MEISRETFTSLISVIVFAGIIWVTNHYMSHFIWWLEGQLELLSGDIFIIISSIISITPYIIFTFIFIKFVWDKPLLESSQLYWPSREEFDRILNYFSLTLVVYVVFILLITITPLQAADSDIYVGPTAVQITVVVTNLLTAGLIAGVVEEYVFRGTVQEYLQQHFHPYAAIFVTSLVFAILHIPINMIFITEEVLYAVLVGSVSLVWGHAYYTTENLFGPIVLHTAYNTFLIFIFFFIA